MIVLLPFPAHSSPLRIVELFRDKFPDIRIAELPDDSAFVTLNTLGSFLERILEVLCDVNLVDIAHPICIAIPSGLMYGLRDLLASIVVDDLSIRIFCDESITQMPSMMAGTFGIHTSELLALMGPLDATKTDPDPVDQDQGLFDDNEEELDVPST